MTDFNKFCFVVEEKYGPFAKRKIYRYVPSQNYFVLVTPNWEYADRRMTLDEIETLIRRKKFIPYTKSDNVFSLINRAWSNYTEEWAFNGKRFVASLIHRINEAPIHETKSCPCRIGYHHGKLVWVSGFQYMPRVCYCPFESIDKKPDWSKVAYTNISNIHPVWCYDTNSFI